MKEYFNIPSLSRLEYDRLLQNENFFQVQGGKQIWPQAYMRYSEDQICFLNVEIEKIGVL